MSDTQPPSPSSTSNSARLSVGKPEFVAMIAGLMALNALAIDVMLPALEDIATALGVVGDDGLPDNRQQWIIYAYIFGFGAPQIIWGPISDRFGRRAPLFISLVGYIVTGLACALMKDFNTLLAMRFTQGVFASGARIVAVSIVRDLFVGRGMAAIMSLVMTVFMVVPILAPTIGQLVLYIAPWEWTFGVLAIFGALMLVWTALRLPETLPGTVRQPLNLKAAGRAYGQVLKSRVTFGYMCASGIIFGSLFAFIGASPQVFREVFGKDETFVYWFAGIAGTLACANFMNSRLVERFGMRRLSQAALIGFITLSLLNVTVSVFAPGNFILFFPLFALTFGCFGLIGANFNALAMEPLGKIAGTASAAYGFATTTVSSVLGFIIGYLYNGSTVPLLLGFVVLGVTSLSVVAVTERGKMFSSR
jgi:DHA1 family bicyclomycin/chloramphenicol resistance-like MFS transporter